MIAALKRVILFLVGASEAPADPFPGWVRELKDRGYRVHYRFGRWHWYHWDGVFSGSYETERGAWGAAAEDFEERKDEL